MDKEKTVFTSVVNGIQNSFHFQNGCPTQIAKESIFQCIRWIIDLENNMEKNENDFRDSLEKQEKEDSIMEEE